ncbi:MAG TPA: ATP-binding protein [Candidatus Nitrosotenuis sp.]|nr:ATP-binding protein [Candidatus Nitrosotenuis sp.]
MKVGVYHVQLMRYYDEVLTQSARNYAFTGDKKWALRYKAVEPLSEQLIRDIIKNADDKTLPFFENIGLANIYSVKMEYEALELVNKGKKEDAVKLLEGSEYAREKKFLAEGLEDYVAKMQLKQENNILSGILSPSVQQIVDLERKMAVLEDSVKKEKMLAIGELAARLAHDIRNPLSIIKNSIDVLVAQNQNIDKKTLDTYERIQRAVDRISYQIDDVLNFVRPRMISLQHTSVNKILNSVINRLKLPSTVQIILPKKDIELVVDIVNIEIAFVNLITNALQAMDNTGRITIESDYDGTEITIKISDTGPGIPEDLLPQIFEPLFTTKQTGTGLGLVSCKTIIEQHGGTIGVESTYGKGATFIITLPNRKIKSESV